MRRSAALPAERGRGWGYSPRAMEQGRGDSGDGERGAGGASLGAGGALLGTDEPPAFEVLNPEGTARFAILCDHASNRVPRALDSLGLPPAELERHIAWDIGAAAITRRLAAHFDAPAVLAGYSRLVIDCNRRLEDIAVDPLAKRRDRDSGQPGPHRRGRGRQGGSVLRALPSSLHRGARRSGGAGRRGAGRRDDAQLHPGRTGRSGRGTRASSGTGTTGGWPSPSSTPFAPGTVFAGDNEPYTGTSPHGYTMPTHCRPARARQRPD